MTLFEITETIGIISFALSGFLAGVREKLDLLGISLVAFLTALGGGITRDIIVGNVPYSLKNPLPICVVFGVVAIALIFKLYKKSELDQTTFFIITDSIGLVSFSITGALIGLKSDLNFFGVILISFLTAIGGGIIRDVLINKVPFILKIEFYGSVAILVGFLVYLLGLTNHINFISILIVFIFGVTLRLVAYFKKWHLPSPH